MKKYHKGEEVTWKWGQGQATGEIQESYTEKVTKQINGSEITRDASKDNPAYMIKQEDGSRVLKSHSELNKK